MHVFRRIAHGQSATAIAEKLGVCVKTIEAHQRRINAVVSTPSALLKARGAMVFIGTGQSSVLRSTHSTRPRSFDRGELQPQRPPRNRPQSFNEATVESLGRKSR